MTPTPLPTHMVHVTGLLVMAIAVLLSVLPADAAKGGPKKPAVECLTKGFRRMGVRGGSNVRVLSAKKDRKDAKRIAQLIDDEIYPRLRELLQREPPADDGQSCFHGPDGKLDVYVTTKSKIGSFEMPEGVLAFVHPFDRDRTCAPKEPVFVVVRPDATRAIIAHELFHAFSSAFGAAGDCEDYSMWEEGLATWAEADVYPDDQTEHIRTMVIEDPEQPLEIQKYPTWVLPYYLTQRYGRDVVRKIMEAREQHEVTAHIDAAVEGGFRRHFAEFALYAWNQEPIPQVPDIGESFREWDAFTPVPTLNVDAHQLALGGASRGETSVAVHTSIRNLSREYRRITVADENIRQLRFENPGAGIGYFHVRAFVRRADGSWLAENWDGKPTVSFCRDDASEDVQEIILVYANSSWNTDEKVRAEPRLVYEDTCALHFRVLGSSIETHTSASASDLLCGTVAGEITFSGTGGADAFDETNRIVLDGPRWEGDIGTRALSQWTGHELEGCTLDTGRPRCSTTMPPRRPGGDGTWPVGFSVGGNAGDDTLELRWNLSDPSVGFVDAGDDECNVYVWAPLDVEDGVQRVPLATFQQTAPFTLTFSGTSLLELNWADNEPAEIDHAWTYEITLQRVGADGRPLAQN